MTATLSRRDPSDDTVTLARGAGTNLLALVSRLGRPAFYLTAARLFAADTYGLYFLAWSYVELVSGLARFGLDKAILRHIAHYNAVDRRDQAAAGARTALLIGGAIGISASLAVCVLSGSLAHLAGKPALGTAFRWLAFVIFFQTATGLLLQVPVAHKVMKYQLYIKSLLEPALLIAFAVLMSQAGTGVARLCQAHLLAMSIVFCLSVVPCLRLIPLRLWLGRGAGSELRILRFSTPMFLADTTANLSARLDVFLLGYYATPTVVGVYGVMVQLASLVQSVRFAFDPIANAFFTERHAWRDLSGLEHVYRLVTRWVTILAVPVFLLLVVFGRELAFLAGPVYMQGYPWLVILALGSTAAAVTGLAGYVLAMTGHPAVLLRSNIVALLISAGFTVPLVRWLGPLGAAIGGGLALTLANVLASLQVRRLHSVHALAGNLWKPLTAGLLAGLTMAATGRLVFGTPGWNVLVHVPLLLASYGGLLFWFGLEGEERMLGSRVYRRARNAVRLI